MLCCEWMFDLMDWLMKIERNCAKTTGKHRLACNAVAAYRCVLRSDGYWRREKCECRRFTLFGNRWNSIWQDGESYRLLSIRLSAYAWSYGSRRGVSGDWSGEVFFWNWLDTQMDKVGWLCVPDAKSVIWGCFVCWNMHWIGCWYLEGTAQVEGNNLGDWGKEAISSNVVC